MSDDPDETPEPEVLHEPRPFEFTRRPIALRGDKLGTLLAMEALPDHPTDALALNDGGELLRINLESGLVRRLQSLTPEELRWDCPVSMVVSRDGSFAALTSSGTEGDNDSFNRGVVIDLESGLTVLGLDCGDYQTHHAPFPVGFMEREGRTLVIHATDWNHMDVTDPRTGECLTARKASEEDATDKEETIFTEWLGELKVSPNQRRVATIGWMWHPVGIAFSWNLDTWLTQNPHESDTGRSKRSYAMWEYFWDSPFFWLDDRTLCIWGDDERQSSRDMPPDSVVLYDAETGNTIRSIPGPTIGSFHFDRYLFTEAPSKDGLAVWDLERGSLIHEQPGIAPRMYHHGLGEFIEIQGSDWVAWRWRELTPAT